MDNPTVPPPLDMPSKKAFKKWSECLKTLKNLSNPVSDTDRHELLDRINSSPQRLNIAFEVLGLIRESKLPAHLAWLELAMLEILGDGHEEPHLENKTVASESKTWVYSELREVRNGADWKRFVSSGRHLWVLYAILKAAANKPVFVEALTALAECAEHCLNTSANGKMKRIAILANDASWIAKVLKGKIPAKLDLPKSFIETLFAINASADLSEPLRRKSIGLEFSLKQTQEDLDCEKKLKCAAEDRAGALEAELIKTKALLELAENELKEERLHIARQGGFNEVAKDETINRVMSHVRQGVVHRLENIAAYADRPNPNREEILELVVEIQNHLSEIEEVIKK